MRDVDFLPEWYKEGRRRQSSVQRQYVALGMLFLIMVVWNAVATRSISLATVDLADAEPRKAEAERICNQFDHDVRQLAERQQGLHRFQDLESRPDVASILAEVSALIGEKVVLETMELRAEGPVTNKFEGPSGPKRLEGASAAQASGAFAHASGLVRFRVTMKGLAQDAQAVASLLKAMETSTFFRQVCLVYSRDQASSGEPRMVPGDAGASRHALAFEIGCFLAYGQNSGQDR